MSLAVILCMPHTLPSSIRWIFEMTPKLPLPILLTSLYLSISEASANSVKVGVDAAERRCVADIARESDAWRLVEAGVFTATEIEVPSRLERHQEGALLTKTCGYSLPSSVSKASQL